MTMNLNIDYKLIHALDAVITEKSFENAADKLHITQSAISQRIKQLEQLMAEPLIIRGSPPTATEKGQKLIKHLRQVVQLEYELINDVLPQQLNKPVRISLALNADTLASWFIPAITPILQAQNIELDLHVANELNTQKLLKRGEVYGAISSRDKAVSGCKVQYLGDLQYILCASPRFKQKYFANGLTPENLDKAPAVDFDQNDNMHRSYLHKYFDYSGDSFPCHRVRSSEAFITMALADIAYSILPITQAQPYLKTGELIDLAPNAHLIQQLYWHSWVLEKGVHKTISMQIVRYANNLFNQQ